MDVLTKEQRSYCMSQIRKTNTTPELMVRRIVHRLGYRFRLYRRDLPGCPDIVLPRHRKVIFVHGCWWHRHNCRYGRRTPKTRQEYWIPKLQGNKERYKRDRRALQVQGWKVLTVWECQTKKLEKVTEKIVNFLTQN
ncbi:MAG: very short patch repair endonuclease [Planctomycetes bacterium B3_Pla]|nr:MAG: very short patch repair endonuclease [Planctomycetes bacterium B3_Pla]